MLNLLVSNSLLFGNLFFCFSKLFQKRQNKYISLILYIVFIGTSTLLHIYLDISFKTIVIMFMTTLFISICFHGAKFKKLFTLFTFFVIYIIAELFSANILLLITGIDATIEASSNYFMLGIIISNLLIVLFTYLATKLFKLYLEKKLPTYSWIILILPITTIALVLNLENYVALMRQNFVFIIILFGFIVSNIITIFIFFKVISYFEYKITNSKIKLEDIYLKSKYNLLEQQYNQSFSFLHDILKKSITLQNLLNSKNYEELDNELNMLTNKTFKSFNMLYTNSDVINNIMNSKLSILSENDIEIRFTIEYNNFSFLSLQDQFLFFSSLLDFLISASIKSTNDERIAIFRITFVNNIVKVQLLYKKYDIDCLDEYDILVKFLDTLKSKHEILYSLEKNISDDYDSFVIIFNSRKEFQKVVNMD